MRSDRLLVVFPTIFGGAAVIVLVGLTAACGKAEQAPEPTSSTTTTTTTTTATTPPPPPVTPTEKAPRIPAGPNPFSPDIRTPPKPIPTGEPQ